VTAADVPVNPLYARGSKITSVPRHELPADEMLPETAYQIIHDELMLDGNARLNLATFVTTWMEPEAQRLMFECVDKNMIDKDEYPQTAELEQRCVSMLARLWNAPDSAAGRPGARRPVPASRDARRAGAETAMAAGQAGRKQVGGLAQYRDGRQRPGAGKKFANYFDVEPRMVPMQDDRFHLTPEEAVKHCDENTIRCRHRARLDI